MSGYTDLRDLGVVFRPPSDPLPRDEGRPSPFEASWSSTVSLLARELRSLGAERIAVELAIADSQIRADGLPRADARLSADGVRIAFHSLYGPLIYETATFGAGWHSRHSVQGWQANVRAIALGLEALRKVDRYGISKRGEQYRGWKALPTGTDPADAIVTLEQARAVVDHYGGLAAAIKATHPDTGGDATEFRKVLKAKELLS